MGALQQGPGAARLQPLHLAATVPAGQTLTVERRIQQDCTLVAMRIRIYVGAQLALRLTPYIVNARGQRRDLVAWGDGAAAKRYIDGDDDLYEYSLSEPIDADADERICIDAVNTDAANALDFSADFGLDYSNGQFPGVHGRG